jgi:DNA mismatch endonuclease Vsr
VGNAVPPLMARAIRDQIGRDLLLARSNRPAERLSDHKPDPPVVVSKERSRIMRAVPSRNTSAEIALRKALWAAGLRGFRTQARAVPGNPDIVFARQKVAIFVDGCFWHPPTRRIGR